MNRLLFGVVPNSLLPSPRAEANMISRRDWLAASAAVAAFSPRCLARTGAAVETNVYAAGESIPDYRLGKPKTLNDYFPFAVPNTLKEWKTRAETLRMQLRVALGLWPEPVKTPLNTIVHGKKDRGEYTIEKVYFASTPGHYVTGNLYRPANRSGQAPGVLFAHGHWDKGRFHDAGDASAKGMVQRGEEVDVEHARLFMQALPITLAKLGFVCFQFDMVGYADSTAIPHIARSGVPHPEGFADAAGELRLQSLLGLQAWNCIRSIDFLQSLPDVDRSRIGMTGASGGGSQTFITAAIDDRITAAFPAVMVSTGMQGGCVCENCSLLRVGTGNIEIAGLIAPRPLAMSGANDWTKEIETKGLPELKKLYSLFGKEDLVHAKCWPQFPHNYNKLAREMMYGWFVKHLMNKPESTLSEPLFEPLPPKELSVFDAEHPRPKDELKAKELREKLAAQSDKQIADIVANPDQFRAIVAPALKSLLVTEYPTSIVVRKGPIESKPDGVTMHRAAFGRTNEADAVPGVGVFNAKFTGEKVVVWIDPKGKQSLFQDDKLVPAARTLIDAGFAIVSFDSLGTGELTMKNPTPVNKTYAGFTYGYNRSLLAHRVHDILTALAFAKTMLKAKTLHLVGWGEAGPWTVLAKAMAGDVVNKLAADLNQFRFDTITATDDPMMLPGAMKYGGMPAFLALCAPGAVLAHNHRGSKTGRMPKTMYDAARASYKLKRESERLEPAKVVAWLTEEIATEFANRPESGSACVQQWLREDQPRRIRLLHRSRGVGRLPGLR
jgi:hypothetical protein